jgi:hypothetical protein
MLELVNPGDLRAGDADRERVAERLRTALDEGRINLYEYDERLRDAYAAKTYSELDALLADLPEVTRPAQSQIATRATASPSSPRGAGVDRRQSGVTGRWIVAMWGVWARVVSTCVLIWGVTSAMAGEIVYFWPIWVAGPWGAVLLVQTVVGLGQGEPARWEARRVRRRAERDVRRRAREDHDRTG